MTHIDEGTIHAWLDGALGAPEAAAVESHVRECARCGEAVAQARGLLAGASRILGALDDVPAGVNPVKQAPVRKQKRMWRAAPWVTGIAAVLMAAVVLRTGNHTGREDAFTAPQKATSVQPELAAADSAPERPQAQADQVAAAPPATRRVAVPSPAAAPAANDLAGESRLSPDEARGREAREAFARAGDASRSQRGRATEVAVTSAPVAQALVQPPSMEVPVPQRMSLSDMRTVPRTDPPRDSVSAVASLAGCYRVVIEPRANLSVGAAAEPTRMRARGAVPMAAAVAPSEARVTNRLMVRLDSLAQRAGFIVREARSDSSLGWWSRIGADSARVELLTAGVALVAGSDRIACPDR